MASVSLLIKLLIMKKIYFDKEYIFYYDIIVVNTGEILISGKKNLSQFDNSVIQPIIEDIVKHLHKTDSIQFRCTFRPRIVKPLIPFVF